MRGKIIYAFVVIMVCLTAESMAQGPVQRPNLELVVQTGHTGAVYSVSLSGDGRYLASGSNDYAAILWNAQTGEKLRAFIGHAPVWSVSVNADGRLLATGSADGIAVLWNAQTGQKLRVFAGHSGGIPSVSLSQDSRFLATGSFDKSAILWNAQTGEKLRTFTGHTDRIISVSLSADGRLLATGSRDRTAILWNAQTGEKLRTLEGHTAPVWSVSLSPDGRLLATGSSDKTAILWDVQTGEMLRTFEGHTSFVLSVSLSSDGRYLATGSSDKSAILWNAQTGEKLHHFTSPVSLWSVSLSTNGRLAAGSAGGAVILWNIRTGELVHVLARRTGWVLSVSLSGNGQFAATGEWDKTANLWNAQTGQKLRTFAGHTDAVNSVSLSADGRLLASGSKDKTAILWDVHTGGKLRTFEGHISRVNSAHLSADGRLLATGSADKTAILWNTQTGEKLHTFKEHTALIRGVSLSADGRYLATGSQDKTVILWNAQTGRKLHTFEGHVNSVVSLSPDGRLLVTGSDDTAIIWNAQTGEKLRAFAGHDSPLMSVSLSADGLRVVTGSADGTTRIWDTSTGKELAALISLNHGMDWLVVTPDGYFDGSENAAKYISYRIAGTLEMVPLERYRKQFERPGLLAAAWKGEDYRGGHFVLRDVPPVVRITSPGQAVNEVTSGKLTVTAEAESRGEYPVTHFRLKLNGKPYSQNEGLFQVQNPQLGKATARWEIDLEPGQHTLEVMAYNAAVFNVSEPVEVKYLGSSSPSVELPMLYVLAVGISQYPKEADRLDYAHRDAEELAKAYQQYSRPLFKSIETRVLTDAQATRDAILEGLEWLRTSATQKDFAVFFYAGHGVKDLRNRFYLLPVDGDVDKLTRTGIDGEIMVSELISIPGQVVVLLDACHSGAVGPGRTRGLTVDLLKDLSSEEKGVAIMSSATGTELAQESREHQHGIFTAALLEAIRGTGSGGTSETSLMPQLTNGALYFKELDSYVTQRVKQLSKGYQHPVTSTPRTFRDFPISKPK